MLVPANVSSSNDSSHVPPESARLKHRPQRERSWAEGARWLLSALLNGRSLLSNLWVSPRTAPLAQPMCYLRPSYAKIWARSDAWKIGPWRIGTSLKSHRHFQWFPPWRPSYGLFCRLFIDHWIIWIHRDMLAVQSKVAWFALTFFCLFAF